MEQEQAAPAQPQEQEQTPEVTAEPQVEQQAQEQPQQAEVEENEEDTQLKKRTPEKKEAEVKPQFEIDPLWLNVQGIRKFMKDYEIMKALKKAFKDQDMGFTHLIKEKKKSHFFIKLENLEKVEAFKKAFPFKIKNRKVRWKEAHMSNRLISSARTMEQVQGYLDKRTQRFLKYTPPDPEFLKEMTQEKVIEMLKGRICGYHDMEYSEQIEKKREILKDYLIKIREQAQRDFSKAGAEIDWDEHNGLGQTEEMEEGKQQEQAKMCCQIQDFIECEESSRKYYRNKSEFTIGKCLITDRAKVGFNVSSSKHHFFTIERGLTPDDTLTCPISAWTAAGIIEDLVHASNIPLWYRRKVGKADNGFWRNLIVRQSPHTKEMLINLVGRKAYFEEGQEGDNRSWEESITNWFVPEFVKRFSEAEALEGFTLSGLTFQNSNESSDSVPYVQDSELEVLAGNGTVYHERVCGNLFEVSNSSFLQINSVQMDKMYEYVGNLAKLDENTILLDICSGIGTIGISVGQGTKKVIGIEMVESSCENARKNAANCEKKVDYEVICGKVEEVIGEVVEKHSGNRLVGIIDPPRAGLHPSVVKALRTCKGLDELVFMACDLNQSKRNIVDLCTPQSKKRRGPQFTPILAAGVDMFPNTRHFEAIFYLKRL